MTDPLPQLNSGNRRVFPSTPPTTSLLWTAGMAASGGSTPTQESSPPSPAVGTRLSTMSRRRKPCWRVRARSRSPRMAVGSSRKPKRGTCAGSMATASSTRTLGAIPATILATGMSQRMPTFRGRMASPSMVTATCSSPILGTITPFGGWTTPARSLRRWRASPDSQASVAMAGPPRRRS